MMAFLLVSLKSTQVGHKERHTHIGNKMGGGLLWNGRWGYDPRFEITQRRIRVSAMCLPGGNLKTSSQK